MNNFNNDFNDIIFNLNRLEEAPDQNFPVTWNLPFYCRETTRRFNGTLLDEFNLDGLFQEWDENQRNLFFSPNQFLEDPEVEKSSLIGKAPVPQLASTNQSSGTTNCTTNNSSIEAGLLSNSKKIGKKKTGETKKDKKKSKAQQSKYKNIPGHILSGLRRFWRRMRQNQAGPQLTSIRNLFNRLSEEKKAKLNKLLDEYGENQKHWGAITKLIQRFNNSNPGDNSDIIRDLCNLIQNFLSNPADMATLLDDSDIGKADRATITDKRSVISSKFAARILP
jgi:hypothetical protein